MTREPIEVTRQDRIYCLKASSDYHRELCEECRFYPNCDHMTQDDMTELTIKDLEALEQEPMVEIDLYSVIKQKYIEREVLDKIREEIGKAWHTKPKNRYEEGLKDQALRDMKIIDKYKTEARDKE